MVTATLRPRGPYSLRLSTRHGSDATRRVADGVYLATIAAGGGLEQVRAWQRPDGAICVQAASEAGVEHVRFVLGLEDDHSEFLRRFADDPMIGEATRRFRGLRPLRTATVAQSLLRAVAGQLITASRARADRAHRDPRGHARRSAGSTRRRPRPTSGASRPPSSSGSASARAAAPRSSGSAARSTSRR